MSEPVNGAVGVAQGVWKAFGETQALRDVSLDVGAGECHGLVGRNGAGKSTLVAIFTGLIRTDRGVVRLGAEAAPALADRATWQRLVACVYQKPMVVPSLTVAENVFLNRATGDDHGIVNWRAMRSRARQVMLDWGFDLDVNRLARDLTVEQRQVGSSMSPQRRWRRPLSNACLKGSAGSKGAGSVSSTSPITWRRSMRCATGSPCCATANAC